MKKSTKPISSPGRTEKFPPPLMRFLRSNVGNKSSRRGRRSRASPMFIKKKNTLIQEPSSPKVTCIGQVRVRRSKNKNATTTVTTTADATTSDRRHSRNQFCGYLKKLEPKSCFSVWSKWVSFFRCGYCKKTKKSRNLHDSPEIEGSPIRVSRRAGAGDDIGEEQEQENINQGLILKSPPKNAFMLTRCRSAPYRSSSLASKFWESTVEKIGDEEIEEKIKKLKIKKEEIGDENGVNGMGKCNDINGGEEIKGIKAPPLILTRCKSEPARTWDQLLV